MTSWTRCVVAAAGLMGMAGVALAAAGSHAGGGDLARTAAEFLLIHAGVALCAALAVALGLEPGSPWLVAATTLEAGTLLFSADLGLLAFGSLRPFPPAAPIGGVMMMLGWLGLVVAALRARG